MDQTKNDLMNLTDKLNLNNNVHFCGPLSGSALDDLFNIADMAVGSIGIYRIGLKYASPLKEKEYCARGIPFITTYNKLYEGCEFVVFEENCDTDVDISNIVNIFKSKIRYIQSSTIREFALKKFAWEIQIEKIIQVGSYCMMININNCIKANYNNISEKYNNNYGYFIIMKVKYEI